MRPSGPLEITNSLTILGIGLNNSTEKKFFFKLCYLKKKKKTLIPNMSECGQSALKDFVTKKIKSPKCNGDDGKCRTSATVKHISQNSHPLRNLNPHKTGWESMNWGHHFYQDQLVASERNTVFPVLAPSTP